MVSISVHRDLLKWSVDYMGRLQDPSKITYMERVSGSRHKPSRGVVWCGVCPSAFYSKSTLPSSSSQTRPDRRLCSTAMQECAGPGARAAG